jgi:hypothetical protein
LALLRAVAFDISIDVNLDYLVRGQEAVADALAERVGKNRVSEIIDVRDIFRFLWRRGEADLRSSREIFEDWRPAPGAT